MKEIVKIRKQGKFYVAYEDDGYVIHAIMGYKMSNGKVGFPINSLGKVTAMLEEYKINYQVLEKEEEITKMTFPKNHYRSYCLEGKKQCDEVVRINCLIEKIKNLSQEQLALVLKYIEEI